MPSTLRMSALDASVEVRFTGPGTPPLLDAATLVAAGVLREVDHG